MKITLLTSNKKRHLYLINMLSKCCKELNVIQECDTIFPGKIKGNYKTSTLLSDYFDKVYKAENKFFPKTYLDSSSKIKIMSVVFGDLNKFRLKKISNFLKSDLYIVFGSSYIKGKLADFLIKKKAINIHMGVSPYYRGTDCNFWAIYDGNPHLVGATVHLLSKGLDNGPILFHCMSNLKKETFNYTMSTVKSAFLSIKKKIINKDILKIKPTKQDKFKEIRYSKKKQFNDKILKKFNKKKINLKSKKFNKTLLVKPYFLN